MDMLIRRSHPKVEGVFQASKWLKYQVLLDVEEMKDLLSSLEPISFFQVSQPVSSFEGSFSSDEFLSVYAGYIAALKEGRIETSIRQRSFFSSALSRDFSCFYAMELGGEKVLVKPLYPVIQLQSHAFFYSTLDGKFHPMVQSIESISWGLQFSYPQLFQDPQTHQVVKVSQQEAFVNTEVFARLTQWIRSYTLPTPFAILVFSPSVKAG